MFDAATPGRHPEKDNRENDAGHNALPMTRRRAIACAVAGPAAGAAGPAGSFPFFPATAAAAALEPDAPANRGKRAQQLHVVALCGSARKEGNTFIAQTILRDILQENGIQTRTIEFHDKTMQGCLACGLCKGKAACVVQDDFNACLQAVKEADGVILGSPTYSGTVSARMKAFLERAAMVAATNPGLLRRKVGASVAVAGRAGGLQVLDPLNHFLLNKEMLIPGSSYWNILYGYEIGAVLKDEKGLQTMRDLAENMSWLLQRIDGRTE